MESPIETGLNEAEYDNLLGWLQGVYAKENAFRHPAFDLGVVHQTELSVHAEGLFPVHLIETGRPGEPPEIVAYRKAIFQPTTMSEWEKARNVVMRIFQPGGFQIAFKQEQPNLLDETTDLEAYTEKDFGAYGSLLNFVKDVLVQNTLADPNGVVAVINQVDEAGSWKEPLPYVFGSRNVLWKTRDLVILESAEKSMVKTGSKPEQSGFVGFIFTRFSTYKFKQYGKKSDLLFELELLDDHQSGYIAVEFLGGTIKSKNGVNYYSSFFSGVIPHWNKAITIASDFDGFLYRHLNPTLVRAMMPCMSCRGVGKVHVLDEYVSCNDCAGHGFRGFNTEKSGSPYQDVTFDLELLAKTGTKPSELLAYVAPPVANFEQVRNEIDSHIDRGFSALNMEVVSRVGAVQSGVAKALDRQDLNGFLSELSIHFFDQIEWLYRAIAQIRYQPLLGEAWVETLPDIIRPMKFDYVTTDSMLSEMQSAKNAEAHPSIIRSLNISAAHKLLGEKSIEAKMVQAQITLDPYDGMSEDSILALNSAGVLEKTDLYIHANISNLIQDAIEKDPEFLDITTEEQRVILNEIASEKLGGQAIQTTNKLRETVGGIEGILKIAEQLNFGIIDESAAIGILTDIYNFPIERASEIVSGFIKKPAPIPAPAPKPAPVE